MITSKLILILSITTTLTLFAADDDQRLTDNRINGRAWLQMDLSHQLLFLRGYNEGLQAAMEHSGDKEEKLMHQLTPTKLTFLETTSALNTFYKDDAMNMRIDVKTALCLINLKSLGSPPEEIEVLRNKYLELLNGAD